MEIDTIGGEDLDEASETNLCVNKNSYNNIHYFLHLCTTSFTYGKDELNLGEIELLMSNVKVYE